MDTGCDYLVLGSGLAGLSFALKAATSGRVVLVTKRALEESNTANAQGGIAGVVDPGDTFASHIEDTLEAGAGLCRREAVEMCVREGPQRIAELVSWGVPFDRQGEGFDLGREGGHSRRRILHAGDITGRQVAEALIARVRESPEIRVLEHHTAIDLITARKLAAVPEAEDRCLGAYLLDNGSGEVRTLLAPVVLLATGGAGKVYLYTSNPDVACGDGIAMAWRAGAEVGNLEFMQFHPTCLYHPEAKSFLISEALRGEGGVLRRLDGGAFMADYHPRKDLAPRDIVARAIDTELKRSGDDHVTLDMTHLDGDFLRRRFPNIHATCLGFGVDLTREPIPVVPAAHYMCGGVVVDGDARTTLPGLYAAGEVAMSGLHGANRLASNSLLEAAVLAHRAFTHASARDRSIDPLGVRVPHWNYGDSVTSDESVVVTHNWDELRRSMWNYVGIVRTDRRLERARHRIDLISQEIRDFYWHVRPTTDLLELRNLALAADLIVRCAQARRESRGLHYSLDCPGPDPGPPGESVVGRDGKVRLRPLPEG